MSEIIQTDSIVKGSVTWFEMEIDRTRKGQNGLVFFVRTEPRIEELMRTLGRGTDTIEAYGKTWFPVDQGQSIDVYRLERDNVSSPQYTINAPSEGLISTKDGRLNLSFLRFVGTSSPNGIKFGVEGIYTRDYVKEKLRPLILTQVRNFVQDYLVPFHINLRISSQEF